jgi:glycosyltransferase involved in cell wall biosynthesis
MLERITPLILTYNEEANIGRLMQSLAWARRVVVLDSGSSDATREIATSYPNAQFVVRPFDELARQWNFGLVETGIDSDWVLALDADYGLSPEFVEELRRLDPPPEVAGFRARFTYCIDGKPLRGGLYPPVTVLVRRRDARYRQDGHAHRAVVDGAVRDLDTRLRHDDRKPIERWFWSQVNYMRLEARKLRSTPAARLGWPDRIRKLVVLAPALVFVHCLLVKGCILDGREGLTYALQRAVAEGILSLFLLEEAMRNGRSDGAG